MMDVYEITHAWSLITGEEADIYVDEEYDLESYGEYDCENWADKFGTDNIGDDLVWCDQDRVWYCTEDPTGCEYDD